MTAAGLLPRLAAGAARRPLVTVALLAALGVVCALAALGLRPTAATDTLVGRSSSAYKDTQRFYARFGEEPVEVLVRGDLRKLVLSSDIDRLVGLEGCLSGNVPASALTQEGGAGGPCGRLARAKAVKVVFGPGTFLNEAAFQIDRTLASKSAQAEAEARRAQKIVYTKALARGLPVQEATTLGEQARKATMAGFAAEVSALAIRYGLNKPPTLNDRRFVSTVVFDSTKPSGTPKQRFAYLFPGRDSALVSLRLKAGLSEARRSHAIDLIRKAVAMPQWRLQNGGSYLVTGEPVIVDDLTGSIARSIELLLVAVLLVMALSLSLIFKGRPRLLPLAVALLAAALTFGGLALWGASLTMASVAVLPVLVGLSVDYAIQFQSRIHEARAAGATDTLEAVRHAAAEGAPALATAALASVGGLLVLMLSPVPMVRGFGLLLVVGVALAFLCALTAGSAAMALAAKEGSVGSPSWGDSRARAKEGLLRAHARVMSNWINQHPRRRLAPAWQGAREILTDNAFTRLVSRLALDVSVRRPGRVLCIGLALAVLGWGLDTQTHVQTDIAKLAPQRLSSLHNLTALERATGVGGEIDLMVSSSALTKPSTIEWMSRYESTVLKRFGYSSSSGCDRSTINGIVDRPARLCPAFSLPDLFQGEGSSAKLSQRRVRGLLAAIPPYFSQDVISSDRHVATLAFGIRLMGLQQQQQVIEGMRASLRPPPGVSARLVGLSVLAAQAGSQVASPWRRLLTLLTALAAVALILLVAFRGDRRRALVPLAPIVLATGWSALVLFALRIPLNPMSVTLGALVIAISTEFSVLLSERSRQERAAGHSTVQALRRAYRRTGAAVAASGVTAIAGFGVLALSDIAMLRDFGFVTLVDLSVSLVGVLVALPAAVVLADRERSLVANIRHGARSLAALLQRRRGLTAP
ncbi:MAG TPA: MMPL family transporter [Solirubrobacteraceae bacterium]|nr:MMPL family transporter [Solirubrobacteraceae bacterium]